MKDFKFNKNIMQLNSTLGRKVLLVLFSLNFIIFYFVICFAPWYFRSETSVLWNSHYIYIGYGVMIAIFESYMTFTIIKIVNGEKESKILNDFNLANYLLPLILSQVQKYDFYTDVIFIISNINEKRYVIAIISGIFLSLTTAGNFLMIMILIINIWLSSVKPKKVIEKIKYIIYIYIN